MPTSAFPTLESRAAFRPTTSSGASLFRPTSSLGREFGTGEGFGNAFAPTFGRLPTAASLGASRSFATFARPPTSTSPSSPASVAGRRSLSPHRVRASPFAVPLLYSAPLSGTWTESPTATMVP